MKTTPLPIMRLILMLFFIHTTHAKYRESAFQSSSDTQAFYSNEPARNWFHPRHHKREVLDDNDTQTKKLSVRNLDFSDSGKLSKRSNDVEHTVQKDTKKSNTEIDRRSAVDKFSPQPSQPPTDNIQNNTDNNMERNISNSSINQAEPSADYKEDSVKKEINKRSPRVYSHSFQYPFYGFNDQFQLGEERPLKNTGNHKKRESWKPYASASSSDSEYSSEYSYSASSSSSPSDSFSGSISKSKEKSGSSSSSEELDEYVLGNWPSLAFSASKSRGSSSPSYSESKSTGRRPRVPLGFKKETPLKLIRPHKTSSDESSSSSSSSSGSSSSSSSYSRSEEYGFKPQKATFSHGKANKRRNHPNYYETQYFSEEPSLSLSVSSSSSSEEYPAKKIARPPSHRKEKYFPSKPPSSLSSSSSSESSSSSSSESFQEPKRKSSGQRYTDVKYQAKARPKPKPAPKSEEISNTDETVEDYQIPQRSFSRYDKSPGQRYADVKYKAKPKPKPKPAPKSEEISYSDETVEDYQIPQRSFSRYDRKPVRSSNYGTLPDRERVNYIASSSSEVYEEPSLSPSTSSSSSSGVYPALKGSSSSSSSAEEYFPKERPRRYPAIPGRDYIHPEDQWPMRKPVIPDWNLYNRDRVPHVASSSSEGYGSMERRKYSGGKWNDDRFRNLPSFSYYHRRKYPVLPTNSDSSPPGSSTAEWQGNLYKRPTERMRQPSDFDYYSSVGGSSDGSGSSAAIFRPPQKSKNFKYRPDRHNRPHNVQVPYYQKYYSPPSNQWKDHYSEMM